MSSRRSERRYRGRVASAGLALGAIATPAEGGEKERPQGSPAVERGRLARAVSAAAAQLASLSAAAREPEKAIIGFQLALLDDPELVAPAEAQIASGLDAARAWSQALDAQIDDFSAAGNPHFRARAADLLDLRDRVLRALRGSRAAAPVAWPERAIYVGEDLTPSRFLEIDWARCHGVALTRGSAASHMAMMARARGVPLVVGLDMAGHRPRRGTAAILDAEKGWLIENPSPEAIAEYEARIGERGRIAAAEAPHLVGPALTRRAERVLTMINIEDPASVDGLSPAHCDGIGLTRTELLFHRHFERRRALPDEAAQLAAYRRIVRWAEGRPVTIRTLDAGGDKPIPGLTLEGERDPFLGLRGLRLLLARPDVFRVQLRALVQAAALGTLRIMLPMVTAPRELEAARALVGEVTAELEAEGLAHGSPALGIMVEVPAAAMGIARFDADFFSLGTNDLVQYVTATSRDNPAVAELYDPLDAGVLELVARVAAHGRSVGKEVSVCGDMAADPAALEALLDAGIRCVSVPPPALARTKKAIAAYG